MTKLLVSIVALALIAASSARTHVVVRGGYQRPVTLNDGWKTASTESRCLTAAGGGERQDVEQSMESR